MKTLLVLARDPGLPGAVRAALPADVYRVVHSPSLDQAEPLLVHGVADVCLLDLDLENDRAFSLVGWVKRSAAGMPVIGYASNPQSEFQEKMFLLGAAHLLIKPFRAQLLLAVLDRLWPAALPAPVVPPVSPPAPSSAPAAPTARMVVDISTLRDFSANLTHTLDVETMMRQFLLQLRDLLGINRAAIFLRPAKPAFGPVATSQTRHLRPAGSVGLPPDLLSYLELSLSSGLGSLVSRLCRIVRRSSPEALADPVVQKEFELLCGQVAVPIMDRESVLGMAVFDTRITGEPLGNQELELIFRLLEQLGLAIRNLRLHEQLVANHALLSDILRELSSACIVVGRDLSVLHANKTARHHFLPPELRRRELEFADLPQELGSKAHQVLQTGAALAQFRLNLPGAVETLFSGTALPFQKQPDGRPASVLLLLEDQTQKEHLGRLEVEAGELREFKRMASRVVAEVGNATTPIAIYSEMLPQVYADADTRAQFENILRTNCVRIRRLLNQIRSLAIEPGGGYDAITL